MKYWYRWSAIYIAILTLAFLASFNPSTTFKLFASDQSGFSQASIASTVYSNTVSYPTTVEIVRRTDLVHERENPLSVLLQNGDVLVTGGLGREVNEEYPRLASTEIYNSETNQWTPSGNLGKGRSGATITLLNSGKVLVTGGAKGEQTSAELYDPALGSWSSAGTMNFAHVDHTATLLANGKVLVVGGTVTQTELYDPSNGSWTLTGNLNVARAEHSATLLPDGKVLVVGGSGGASTSAELYDPILGTWSYAAPMNGPHTGHQALLMQTGKVLISGVIEVYDPATNAWTLDGLTFATEFMTTMSDGNVFLLYRDEYKLYDPVTQNFIGGKSIGLSFPKAWESYSIVRLASDKLLLIGGISLNYADTLVERIDYNALNNFSATLTLPSEWITQKNASLIFRGMTSAALLEAASLKNEDGPQGAWIPVTSGETITTTWDFGDDSISKKVFLSLQDSNDYVVTVVTGTVRVDMTAPESQMTAPTASNSTIPGIKYSPATFAVAWQGSDATSGLAGYDLQVKKDGDADWTPVLANSTLSQTTYTGENEETYRFRVRTVDVAGNVEAWPLAEDSATQVDAEVPNGFVDIATVGATSVLLLLDAEDNLSGVTSIRVSLIDDFEDAPWETYVTPKTLSFGGPAPSQFVVYVQFRDLVGNVSAVECVAYGGAECPDFPAGFEIALPIIRRS